MSKESKKLAKNVLDDKKEFPYAIVVALGMASIAVVTYMSGKFPASMLETSAKISAANITEKLTTGLTTPIVESETETLKTLLIPEIIPEPLGGKLMLHSSASYYCVPSEPGETIESLMREYSGCVKYTNTEMNGSFYEMFQYDVTSECPSLKPEAKHRLTVNNMLTYIDYIDMKNECIALRKEEVKAEMLDTKTNIKQSLLE